MQRFQLISLLLVFCFTVQASSKQFLIETLDQVQFCLFTSKGLIKYFSQNIELKLKDKNVKIFERDINFNL